VVTVKEFHLNALLSTASGGAPPRSLTRTGEATGAHWVDPLKDPRWGRLLERHACATVFHTPEWLEALHRTYGYRPLVLTGFPNDRELTNGWLFCDVNSWLTGRRLVSLPFSDHCDPLLANGDEEMRGLLDALGREFRNGKWAYIQVRPRTVSLRETRGTLAFGECQSYAFHKINLRPGLEELHRQFHKDSVQRKIQKAERERLTCEEGKSEKAIQQFYRLLLLTRRRHRIPPQPVEWYRNLMDCMGEKARIRLTYKNGNPIAGMITLTYKNAMVYKYGCSDERFHNLGGMALLFWRAIQEAKRDGLQEFDLGRSELRNRGLARFKEHWGATRSMLTYRMYPAPANPAARGEDGRIRVTKRFFAHLPDPILTLAGKVLYRHIA
jgi:CelD/BcsL family acetyltransferase involved in cellulose biosynthesis